MFRGVVIVDVPLDELDINQCPAPFHVPNAFKNTARCHFESTYVSTFVDILLNDRAVFEFLTFYILFKKQLELVVQLL